MCCSQCASPSHRLLSTFHRIVISRYPVVNTRLINAEQMGLTYSMRARGRRWAVRKMERVLIRIPGLIAQLAPYITELVRNYGVHRNKLQYYVRSHASHMEYYHRVQATEG